MTVVDRCAGCDLENSLDMTQTAFATIADVGRGRVQGMTWRFID